MNQTIRNYFRVLQSFVHQDETNALQVPTGQRHLSGMDETHAGKTHWGEIKGALIAIAIFASLAVAAVVIRLVAFQPGFVELLERTARLLATGLAL